MIHTPTNVAELCLQPETHNHERDLLPQWPWPVTSTHAPAADGQPSEDDETTDQLTDDTADQDATERQAGEERRRREQAERQEADRDCRAAARVRHDYLRELIGGQIRIDAAMTQAITGYAATAILTL